MKEESQLKVPYDQFFKAAAQCYLDFQRYRLRSNVVSLNLQKQNVLKCVEELQRKNTSKFLNLYDDIKDALVKLQRQFVMAQGSTLRTINNIMRCFKRKANLQVNEPISHFKYNRFDKQQKMLAQSIIYQDRTKYQEIIKLKNQLRVAIQAGEKQIQQRYRKSSQLKVNQKSFFDTLDKCQCYAYRYYTNFQRQARLLVPNLLSHFQKLSSFLTIWQNTASTKVYQIKTPQQQQIQITTQAQKLKTKNNYTKQQLEEMIEKSNPHSHQRQELQRRLNDLQRNQAQKQKKMDNIGKMYSKRKGKGGILINKADQKGLTPVQYYVTRQGNKQVYAHQDEFRTFCADIQYSNYSAVKQQIQPSVKKQKVEQSKAKFNIKNSFIYTSNWDVDNYGKKGSIDFIHNSGQLIQRRIEYQVARHADFEANDDRKKRQINERYNAFLKQQEKKDKINIGFKHVSNQKQLQMLTKKYLQTDYYPDLLNTQIQQDQLVFSDDNFSDDEKDTKFKKVVEKKKKTQSFSKDSEILQHSIINTKQILKQIFEESYSLQNKTPQKIQQNLKQKIEQIYKQQGQDMQQYDQHDYLNGPIQQQIINIYFKQYARKMRRKDGVPYYKISMFFYFSTIQQINWQLISKNLSKERVYILTSTTLIFFYRVQSIKTQKLKCSVFYLDNQDFNDQQIKQKINSVTKDFGFATSKFQPLYVDEQIPSFMLGILVTLIKKGQMDEQYDVVDYVQQGKRVIQDFNCFFYPTAEQITKNSLRKKFKSKKPRAYFKPQRFKKQIIQQITKNKQQKINKSYQIQKNQQNLEDKQKNEIKQNTQTKQKNQYHQITEVEINTNIQKQQKVQIKKQQNLQQLETKNQNYVKQQQQQDYQSL